MVIEPVNILERNKPLGLADGGGGGVLSGEAGKSDTGNSCADDKDAALSMP